MNNYIYIYIQSALFKALPPQKEALLAFHFAGPDGEGHVLWGLPFAQCPDLPHRRDH